MFGCCSSKQPSKKTPPKASISQAKPAAAPAVAANRPGFACPNPQCMCTACTCGAGCTCGVSTAVICDPCGDFKKAKLAAAAAHIQWPST